MDGFDPISDLGLGCPFNGTFYICKDSPTRFIGCCISNPCGDRKGLCPDEHLEPATFEARYRIPPQACINDNFAVSWYTCPDTSPPFLGCCAVDPCIRRGCQDRELRAAKLSDKSDAGLFTGGLSPGSDLKGNPSAKLSITTATLTASYISTKTIEAGVEATSTLDSASPASHPSDGKKGLSTGAIVGIIIAVVAAFFVIGVIIACIYSRCKRRRFRTTENQSSSRWSIALSSVISSQKGPISINGSIYGIKHEGRMTGIQVHSKIPFGQDPGQEIHTGASSEEQHLQQESRERWNQQPQPGQGTLSRPSFTIPRKPVQGHNTDQTPMPYPSTPQPPSPPSSDRQNRWDWGTQSQPDHRGYKPSTPSIKLPANTETSLSTGRSSTPICRTIPGNIGWHEPEPRHPESPPGLRPPGPALHLSVTFLKNNLWTVLTQATQWPRY
ncbi:hypothetical protein MRS44_010025 [Fusarium solani]|uniref:uncharacterized protein n=1 Tax=Fusarium solani TaxID=169388 RepID=UPI0032C4399D|nr:hypothetical protein MRS44_010025 [Fusarium solani]